MTAKVNKKAQICKHNAHFSTIDGRVVCNATGKTYPESNLQEREIFDAHLNEHLHKLLKEATLPLIKQFLPKITETPLYQIEPHFV